MSQDSEQQGPFADAVVQKRIVISIKGIVAQALKVEGGDVLWFWRTKDGAVLVRKAPDDVQKLAKAKQKED